MRFLRILKKILRGISFRLSRIFFHGICIIFFIYFFWGIYWVAKIETHAKKIRIKLKLNFIELISDNDQILIDAEIKKYTKIIQEMTAENLRLKKSAKRDWFKYQIKLQNARMLRAEVLEYSFYVDRLRGVDLKKYFIVKKYLRDNLDLSPTSSK